ncbi:MAG: SDR family oxidoreductase [Alphaproteobacteria bacterium]
MNDFAGQTIIVTGGTKGVGRAIALNFEAAGGNVIICGRHTPDTPIGSSTFVAADIRTEEGIAAVMAAAESTGRLDVLVNNAGGSPPADAATASPRFTESIIRLNLLAPLNMMQAGFAMLAKRGGAIVNIASISGVRASPGTMAYGAAKAGLLNSTKSLGQEWAGKNVRVNAIIAGLIQTEAADDHYGGADGIARIAAELPMGRMATPNDIADAVLWLASDKAAYVSGAALEVHGGGEPPLFLKLAEEAAKND